MVDAATVQKGEVWWLSLALTGAGAEDKLRPCVVVQNDVENTRRDVTIVAAISSNVSRRSGPSTVLLERGSAGLADAACVDCGHIYTVSKRGWWATNCV
jgi:mRNA-degrading endonuclease toxin of MazEF toxin-antitoxin module